MTVLYADASRHNGTIDWSRLTVERVFLKAGGSDAGTYADAAYPTFARAARAVGKLGGAYWFNGTGTPAADASFFLSHLADYRDGDLVILDVEDMIGEPGTAWSPDKAMTFFKTVRRAKPRARLVAYMNQSVENGADWGQVVTYGVELWLAHYGKNDGTIAGSGGFTLKHWSKPLLVQYTSVGRTPGFSGDVDLSYAEHSIFGEDQDVVDNSGSGSFSPAKPLPISTTGWTNWIVDAKGNYTFCQDFEGLLDVDVATRIEGLPTGATVQARFAVVTYTNGKPGAVSYSDVVELQGSPGAAFPAFSDKIRVHANQRVRLIFAAQQPGAAVARVGLSIARFKLVA